MYYDGQNFANAQVAPQIKYITGDATVNMPVVQSYGYKEAPRWSWCSTVWSVISCFLCSSFCGFIGLLCSAFSYVDHKSGDFDEADKKRRCAWAWAMTGIVITVLGVIAIILIFVVFPNELRHVLGKVGYWEDPLAEP